MDKEIKIFIYTSPLFYVFTAYVGICQLLNFLGLKNWWFIIFSLNKNIHKESFRDVCLQLKDSNIIKDGFWLNRKAWRYILKAIEKYERNIN